MASDALFIERLQRRQFLKVVAGGFALGAVGGLHRSNILAREATPVAIVDVTPEPLFEITLPQSTFPLGAYDAGFVISTFPPGFVGTLVVTDQVAQTFMVLEGEMTIEKAGPAQVFRKGGSEEAVRSEDKLVLKPGDARVTFDFSQPKIMSNQGTVPLLTLYAPIGFPTEYWKDLTGTYNDEGIQILWDDQWIAGGLSGKALRLRFNRFTLQPGEATIKQRDPYPVLRLMYPGSLSEVLNRTDGSIFGPTTLSAVELPSLSAEAVKQVTWTNVGNEPAVIYEYALQPVAENPATPIA